MARDDESTVQEGQEPSSEPASLKERLRETQQQRYAPPTVLAKGGMGVIEQMEDRALFRPLARKRLRAEVEDGAAERLLVREARVTALLAHPNVVPVHDLGVDEDGNIFFTMHLVGGHTLEELIPAREEGEPVHWSDLLDLLDIVVRVCDALAFAHSRGVVHSDIKPANIMVGEFGEVYLMDWGVARLLDNAPEGPDPARDQFEGYVVGTAAYMPPEQAFGAPLDARSDVFSVGAVLYHIVTGTAPYRKDGHSSAIGKARAAKVVPPRRLAPWVPPKLERVILNAMKPMPRDRYESAAELKTALVQFLRGGDAFDVVIFEAGDVIVREGEEGDRAYIIESGTCSITADGELVREMGPGDVFGELAVLTSAPRSATVTANDHMVVRVVSGDQLVEELDSMKPWMAALVRSLAVRLREST